MKKLLLIFLFSPAIFINILFAQPLVWQRQYDCPENRNNYSYGICNADSENFFITGFKNTIVGGRFYVFKINGYGDTLFTRTLGSGPSFQESKCITEADADGCVIGGNSIDTLYAIKLNVSGDIIWNKKYYFPNSNCYDIKRTLDNGYILCGIVNNFNALIFKIDSQGSLQWSKEYIAAGFDRSFHSVELTPDSGYIFAGIGSVQKGLLKTEILKTDDKGNQQWGKQYTIFAGSTGWKINRIPNGYLIGGGTSDTTNTFGSVYFLRVNLIGDSIYSKNFSSNKTEIFHDIKYLSPNRYILCLERDPSDSDFTKIIISDSLGNIVKQNNFHDRESSVLESIQPFQNSFIITGIIFMHQNDNAYTIRIDSNLYAPPIGINPISSQIPEKLKLYQNYPNPFNPATNIKFDLPKSTNVKLILYNVTGQEISTIIDKNISSGSYEVTLDMSDKPSGVYFIKLKAGSFVQTKKMVLVK